MAGSISEREIRNTVIDKVRAVRPGSRIIHELNTAGTGSPRADLAVIGTSEIILFEIKSEKDVLKRLDSQWNAFKRCSHRTFMVLDKKFFIETSYSANMGSRFDAKDELKNILTSLELRNNVWVYPEPKRLPNKYADQSWKIEPLYNTPELRSTLQLLWKAELVEALKLLALPYKASENMEKLVERIILGATGRQIVEMVCLMLRARPFAEADPAIPL